MSDNVPTYSPVLNETDVADVAEPTVNQNPNINSEGKTQHDELTEVTEDGHECSICLQTCIHPVQLPCSHIFCFLCIKGVANYSKKCALCRSDIPSNFLLRPMLLNASEVLHTLMFDGKYQWFYEGEGGWWQYDIRASTEIEDRYQKGEHIFEMLIAGFLYIVDVDNMIQCRKNTPSRRRRIKRDLATIPDKKGVAGLSYRLCPRKRLGCNGGERAKVSQSNLPNSTSNPSASISITTATAESVEQQMAGLSLVDSGRVLQEHIGNISEGTLNWTTQQPTRVPVDHQMASDQHTRQSRRSSQNATDMSLNQTDTAANDGVSHQPDPSSSNSGNSIQT